MKNHKQITVMLVLALRQLYLNHTRIKFFEKTCKNGAGNLIKYLAPVCKVSSQVIFPNGNGKKKEEHKKSEKQISFQIVLTNCVTFFGGVVFLPYFLNTTDCQ